MKAIYVQKGETLYYISAEDVAPGGLVSLGTRIGVAAAGIAAGETGAVQVEGVFKLAKAEDEPIDLGAAVFYDAAADAITAKAVRDVPAVQSEEEDDAAEDGDKAEGNVPAGYAVQAAAESDAVVLVKLLG